jgi:hypothetical protein
MTPRGYPNFNSYIKNLRVLVFRTDGQTDRQTRMEKLIRCGLGNLLVPPGKITQIYEHILPSICLSVRLPMEINFHMASHIEIL